MSKILEGKVSNQAPSIRLSGVVTCSKCGKVFNQPEIAPLGIKDAAFTIYSYLHTDRFIYESNSGTAVVYCSDYCVKKHNHRFNKGLG
jgi:hypothetical protein